jgi:hypothetical protein
MTILGSHVKVSGSGYSFAKQHVCKENKNKRNQQRVHGDNKKEPKYIDPTVYFNLVISLDVEPAEIITPTSYEWTWMNGQCIKIKELQDLASKTVVSFFKLSTETAKSVIIAKFKKIQNKTRTVAAENYNNLRYKFNWSMEPVVPLDQELPIFTLQNQVAKLRGIDVSIFNKLSYRAQTARKSYHLEVALRHATKNEGACPVHQRCRHR